MQDMVINGTGDSRYLKSVSNFLSLYPTYEDFARALIAGTLPFDLNGVNENGISQLGTALNKANLLKDATAAMYGLGTGATPNRVFEILGEYFKYAWWVQHNSAFQVLKYTERSEDYYFYKNYYDVTDPWTSHYVTVTYYDSVSINSSGNIVGSGPHSLNVYWPKTQSGSQNTVLAGKYLYNSDASEWLHFTDEAKLIGGLKWDGDDHGWYSVYIAKRTIEVVTVDVLPGGTIEYVTSDDPNAYTKFGIVNGDYYRYAGIPFEHFFYSKSIAYSGTGQAQTLEFEANPLMVVVQSTDGSQWLVAIQGVARGFGSAAADVTWAANKVTIRGTVITSGTQYRAAVFYL